MIFERISSPGLAHFSYLIGDQDEGICAVIDPRRDIAVYLELARRYGVRIGWILETHIHADFVSGSRELAHRTGAPIGVGAAGEYGFEHHPLAEGDTITLGSLTLTVLHTPGHTPEHISFLIGGGSGAEQPWGLFTGDTLFAGEVGRPDLIDGQEETLARQLYHTLHDKLLPLGDGIVIYPAHGSGSPCGASIGDRLTSTIGYERQHNAALQAQTEDDFVQQILGQLSPAPAYYPRLKQINARGPHVLGEVPYLAPLSVDEFRREMQQPNTLVLDTREIEAFGGAHIPGSLNIALRDPFPIWVGRVVEAGQRILLVLPDDSQLDQARRDLLSVGYENLAGYLRQGFRRWSEGGQPFARIEQISVHELKAYIDAEDGFQVLDTRSDEEWQQGHIPTARHIFVPELPARMHELDCEQPVAVYCGSGYRASIAASLLARGGFRQVYNVPGSMTAWQAAGYPLTGDGTRRQSRRDW